MAMGKLGFDPIRGLVGRQAQAVGERGNGKTWVSITAIAGSMRSSLSTTGGRLATDTGQGLQGLAGHRGTSPPCCSTRMRLMAMTFLALEL